MAYYSYEARDQKGGRIKGKVEAGSEEELQAMLQTMGFTPLQIETAQPPSGTLYYVGKDLAGNLCGGSIKAANPYEAGAKLKEMGISDCRISTRKNLDLKSDDSPADQFAKGAGTLLFLVIFVAVAALVNLLPGYWYAKHLDGGESRVATGTITQVKSGLVEYAYNIGSATYTRWARPGESPGPTIPKVGSPIQVKYSVNHPSLSRLENAPKPAAGKDPRLVPLMVIIILAAVAALFFASAFHYIARIRQAWSKGKQAPRDDVQRLLNNAADAILFPLIFACMVIAFVGQHELSFYYPLRFHVIIASVCLLAVVLYLKRKAPVYYD